MSKRATTVWLGSPYPLGATWEGEGVNFALFSEHAEKVELCLFDEKGRREVERVELPEQTDRVWHGYLPEARPDWLYGYRVYGPYNPEQGHRFNPNKLLLDPYAKSIVGQIRWSDALYGYKIGSKQSHLTFNSRDSAFGMPKCQVIDSAFTWGDDRPPRTPWADTIIYELHVKGFTAQHPDVPGRLRGTYAGLATAPVIDYLKKLGVTAVELMPVHTLVDDQYLVKQGLRNYWGYNSIGFFAPDMRYSASGQVNEFKTMVKTLHSAGIEVILDVVYNHTAEGNHLGPTLCFRGIDNAAYYRLVGDDRSYYMDFTGCGNTLNMMHPRVLQLIMDSLRYWVLEMHVDGFRFDLASALARELHAVDQLGAFMDIIHQDPVLSQVKLIAEPWDLGEGGYQVGNFPVGWTEWNGKYRDAVRDYWRGEGGLIGELAYRLTGSSDLYETSGRRPYASINFITAHDGFPLNDLVSYNHKHNEANQEGNRDGESHNRGWNCGVEGPTDDPQILRLRARQRRNFLFTLFLSQGVPMLLAGDEIGRTQQGNNNAYCQDNEISWLSWTLGDEGHGLLDFVQRLIAFRKAHPVTRRRRFFRGRNSRVSTVKDLMWLHPEGREMHDGEWHQSFARCLGLYVSGESLLDHSERGHPVTDDDFIILLNAHHEEIPFKIPTRPENTSWEIVFDTNLEAGFVPQGYVAPGRSYPLQGRSAVLLLRHRAKELAAVTLQALSKGLRRQYVMPFGAKVLEDGRVRFLIWAPAAQRVELCLEIMGGKEAAREMDTVQGGWFELATESARAGTRYHFRIDGALNVPDPASRFNPDDVHGSSQVIDPQAFKWHDESWRGRPWEEVVIYELHVGAFTSRGTFSAIKERLDYLVELGVTAIELMPVGDFPGFRSWGYDGVLPFAPDSRYGHPEELKDLVQTAHGKGLMVFLDVVYNHMGPEGNYLFTYAPHFFTKHYDTPWGPGINVDGPHSEKVRDFLIHNALYWLDEFHLDGLRLDAVHTIMDESSPDFLTELAEAVRQGPGSNRHVHLMLENAGNASRYLQREPNGEPQGYNAQWNDDFHHALHVLLTGEDDGYYVDFKDKPVWYLGRCLAEGFAYQGEASLYRRNKPRGEPSHGLPATAFVTFLQNHDQVGNRPFGERIAGLCDPEALRAAVAILLLAPSPPLLFMGEEFAAEQPFLFFCDFEADLAAAVAEGRRKGFARFAKFRKPEVQAALPDPNDPVTYTSTKLNWGCLSKSPHGEWLHYYRRLLAIRHKEIVPRLAGLRPNGESARFELLGSHGLAVRWTLGDGARLTLLANLGEESLEDIDSPSGKLLFESRRGLAAILQESRMPPWSVAWFLKPGAKHAM